MKKIILMSFVFVLVLLVSVNAGEITVKADGSGDYPTVQDAINNSNNGDVIILQLGTYTGPGNRDIDFLGKAITVRSTDPNDPNIVNTTVIDCQASYSNRRRGFYFHSEEAEDSVINGLTIINGYAHKKLIGVYWYYYGGAIFCEGSSPTVARCNISNSTAEWGGGIACRNSSPIISNCTINNNQAGDISGGGIWCEESNSIIKDCIIAGNSAGSGGGVSIYDSNIIISNCDIIENSTAVEGGGINCFGGFLTLTNSTISGNSAGEHHGGGGGGIYCLGGTSTISNFTISNCIITNNTAVYYGGGISCDSGFLKLTDSTINGNSTEQDGGGIFCLAGTSTISNCIITKNTAKYAGGGLVAYDGLISNCIIRDNRAKYGGGLAESSCSLVKCIIKNNLAKYGDGGGLSRWWGSMANCTVAGNTASDGGGGFSGCEGSIKNCAITNNSAGWGGGFGGCKGEINNCTVAGNRADQGGGFNGYGGTITNSIIWSNSAFEGPQLYDCHEPTYSCIQDWAGGGQGNIDSDPCFAFGTDFHIMPGSPCINAGDPNYIVEPEETDLDGNPRVVGSWIDLGAYEYNPNGPSIAASSVSFAYAQGWKTPTPQVLQIRNCGGQSLYWKIVEDCNWLEVSPTNGISTGEINEVTLTVDPNYLDVGFYVCSLEVSDMNAVNSPVSIDVKVNVGTLRQVPEDYATIQAAIDAAKNYDIVLVADGTYTGAGNKNLDFMGKAITVCSENGPNNCTIDCENSGVGFCFIWRETEESLVDGFTITGAGAGILCDEGSPTIINCIITGSSGCGIQCDEQSSPKIANCIITGNTGEYGGICCRRESNPRISDCTITNNSNGISYIYHYGVYKGFITNCNISNNGIGISGGAEGKLTITDCNISNNNCGVSIWSADSLMIANCNISNNSDGGGVLCAEGSLTITDCTIAGNTGYSAMWGMGGGIVWLGGLGNKAIIANCKITGNQAYAGGGVCCLGDSIIENCIISNNLAAYMLGDGGGIVCWGDTEIKNSTLYSNSAEKYGGGIFVYDGHCSITNCILWGNTANDGNQLSAGDPCFPMQGTVTAVYSDVQEGRSGIYVAPGYSLDWGQGNIDTDPLFVNAGNADYHLLPTSPCIDTGDPNYIPEPNETDLDGNPRVMGPAIDMGAYEYRPPITADVSIEPDTLNLASKGNWLTCHIRLPEDYNTADIDPNSIFLENTISADSLQINNDAAVVKFSRSEVQGILSAGECELTITGELLDGTIFEGTDTIRVIAKGNKK